LADLPEMVGRFFVFIGYFGFWSPLPITTFHVHPIGIASEAVMLSLALVQRVNARLRERLAAFLEYGASYGGDYSANAILAGWQVEF
jgi:hypothetical protein